MPVVGSMAGVNDGRTHKGNVISRGSAAVSSSRRIRKNQLTSGVLIVTGSPIKIGRAIIQCGHGGGVQSIGCERKKLMEN